MVGGAELTTGEHATIDSLAFAALKSLGKEDYFRARSMGDDIQNKLIRSRYLLALARGVLNVSDSPKSRPIKPLRSP